jgi:hypothetical protein
VCNVPEQADRVLAARIDAKLDPARAKSMRAKRSGEPREYRRSRELVATIAEAAV